jgi:hypothetical protein
MEGQKGVREGRMKLKTKGLNAPQFVERSDFLRQTWALLKRNAVLHVFTSGVKANLQSRWIVSTVSQIILTPVIL